MSKLSGIWRSQSFIKYSGLGKRLGSSSTIQNAEVTNGRIQIFRERKEYEYQNRWETPGLSAFNIE